MQKIKSFWKSYSAPSTEEIDTKEQSSFLEQASSLISSYRRQPVQSSTSEFEEYLQTIPTEYQKFKKNLSQRKNSKNFSSLKPQLVKKVYERVQAKYFSQEFAIQPQFFLSTKKANRQKQMNMHEDLDQVEVCLFNQITSRFDQVLSVLRTVESLDCIVDYNISKIKNVRKKSIQTTKTAIGKQRKIVELVQRQKNIQKTLESLQKVKTYKEFLEKQKQSLKESQSAAYESIQQLKKQTVFLSELRCCESLSLHIQASQATLKRSFSENLNELIYQYTVSKISPYRRGYWEKFKFRTDILEQEKADQNSTMMLDQSTIIEDESVADQPKLSLNEDSEILILKNIQRGWNEGEYAIGGLKSMIEKHIKALHNNFLSDFRQFCETHLKKHERQVSNPCLEELLEEYTISFFNKACQYYSTLFQNVLYRLCSITCRSCQFILTQSQQSEEMSIEQKEKLTQMLDGINNVLIFVWKSVTEKLFEVIENKEVLETIDISDFKNFIAVIEGFQDFVFKRLIDNLEKIQCSQDSFLWEKFMALKEQWPTEDVITFKKAKLLEYLSKMHKNALEVQLKESLLVETWTPTDIPTFYYDSLHYIITGESLNLRRNKALKSSSTGASSNSVMYDTSVLMESMCREPSYLGEKKPTLNSNFRIIRTEIIIDSHNFKITQTVLLLLEIVEDYMLLKQFYPEIEQEIALKLSEIFRSYNASSLQLIVHAGAVVLGKIKTKSITAKHLALSTLCVKFVIFVMKCIEKRIDLQDHEKIVSDYETHATTTVKKLQTILKSKIAQSLPEIKLDTSPTKGTEAIVNSSKILHDILIDFFDKQTLKRIFTKDITQEYLNRISQIKVTSKVQAESLKDDINFFFTELKFLNELIEGFSEYRGKAQDMVRRLFEELF